MKMIALTTSVDYYNFKFQPMRKKKNISAMQFIRRVKLEKGLAEIPPLPDFVQKILTPKGFISCFWEILPLYDSRIEAYELLENYHIAITGTRRYSEFSSFKAVLHRSERDFSKSAS